MKIPLSVVFYLFFHVLTKPSCCEAGLLSTIAKAVGIYFKVFYPEVTTPRKDYSPDFELQDQLVSQSKDLMKTLVNVKNNITDIEDSWAEIEEFSELKKNPKNIFAESTLGIVDNLSDVISKMSLSSAFKNMEAPIVFLEPPSVAIKQEEKSATPCMNCVGRMSLTSAELRVFNAELRRLRRVQSRKLDEANEELVETESMMKEIEKQKTKIIEEIKKLSQEISNKDDGYNADNVELKFLQSDLAMAEQRHVALKIKQKKLTKKIKKWTKRKSFWKRD
ncbi:secreted protein [Cryptosporidium xiaoi]|uniref:Secreted protein n=1 Tax=Cryptosporidium xiaoi TaxID=659607 RepID=A0AAV9XSE5_9CRYT